MVLGFRIRRCRTFSSLRFVFRHRVFCILVHFCNLRGVLQETGFEALAELQARVFILVCVFLGIVGKI